MAINPPAFNVAPLNPAALLQDRDRSNPFEDLLSQVVGISLQGAQARAQQERSIEARRELSEYEQEQADLRAERTAAERLRQGYLTSIISGEIQQVTEDSPSYVDDLDRMFVPEGLSGEYVRTEDVRRKKPLESLFGREVQEGRVAEDAMDPITGQFNTTLGKGITKGELEKIVGLRDALPQGSDARQAVQSLIDNAQSDDFFSLQEEEEIIETFLTGPMFADYARVQQQAQQLALENRARIQATQGDIARRWGTPVRDEVGQVVGTNQINTADARMIALVETGNEALLSGAQRERVDSIRRDLVPSRGANTTLEDTVGQNYARSGSSQDVQRDYAAVLMSYIDDGRGTVINPELRDEIASVTNSSKNLSLNDVLEYVQNLPASSLTRQALSLQASGVNTARKLEAELAAGTQFPFDAVAAGKRLSELDSSFGEVTISEANPIGGAPDEDTEPPSEFTQMRDSMRQSIRGADPETVQQVLQIAQQGSMEAKRQGLRAMAETADNEEDAEWFRGLASQPDPVIRTVMDSVFIPALQQRR